MTAKATKPQTETAQSDAGQQQQQQSKPNEKRVSRYSERRNKQREQQRKGKPDDPAGETAPKAALQQDMQNLALK